MTDNPNSLGALAGGIASIYDRTAVGNDPICSAWLIGERKAATVASSLIPYAESLKALKLTFSKAGRECGVTAIQFHPLFNLRLAKETLAKGALADAPEVALLKFNCAVLSLSDKLAEISAEDVERVSKSLKFSQSGSAEGFTGSLKEIELPLVLQTVNNAKREGILYICDDLNRPLAQVFCQSGRVLSAKFKNLINETAIYQIVEKGIGSKFAFRNCNISSWLPRKPIAKPQDMLLIESHRRLDELTKIKTDLRAANSYFVRGQRHLDIEQFAPEIGDHAGNLWRVLDGMTVGEDLWRLVGMDDYTVFSVLKEMYSKDQIRRVQEGTRQIDLAALSAPPKTAVWAPLSLGLNVPLPPFEELTSIGIEIDPSADGGAGATTSAAMTKTRIKTGALLGAIDAYDNWHLLHDIPLLPSNSGIPIFKDGLVVGMHCGVVPSSPEIENPTGILQQMLWVEAILACLQSGGEAELVHKLTVLDIVPPKIAADGTIVPAGCSEIAQLTCPRCGEPTFDSARNCKKCQLALIPKAGERDPSRMGQLVVLVLFVVFISVASAAAMAWSRLPQPNFQSAQLACGQSHAAEAGQSWVKLATMKAEDPSKIPINWLAQPAYCVLKNGDFIHFQLDGFKDSYVYVFYKGRWSKEASVMFPGSLDKTNLLPAGRTLHTGSFTVAPPAGRETVVLIASGERRDWLKDANYIEPLFQYAVDSLAKSGNKNGIIIDANALASQLSPQPAPTSSTSGGQLFVTSVMFDHR
jgi:Domain of unknown function (DUF4384)/Domain of unknown function (DUF4388)